MKNTKCAGPKTDRGGTGQAHQLVVVFAQADQCTRVPCTESLQFVVFTRISKLEIHRIKYIGMVSKAKRQRQGCPYKK